MKPNISNLDRVMERSWLGVIERMTLVQKSQLLSINIEWTRWHLSSHRGYHSCRLSATGEMWFLGNLVMDIELSVKTLWKLL